jgi:hypothetical protein
MRRALALLALVSVLASARIVFAESYTGSSEVSVWGLAPLDDTTVARISGRGVARPRAPEPARVILWDEEPPKGHPSVNHAHSPRPSAIARAGGL